MHCTLRTANSQTMNRLVLLMISSPLPGAQLDIQHRWGGAKGIYLARSAIFFCPLNISTELQETCVLYSTMKKLPLTNNSGYFLEKILYLRAFIKFGENLDQSLEGLFQFGQFFVWEILNLYFGVNFFIYGHF